MKNLTKAKLKEALEKNKGLYTYTAAWLKANVKGCENICYQTVSSYVQQWDLAGFAAEQKNSVKDKVRGNIYQWIGEGNEKVTLWFAERQMFSEFGNQTKVINENKEPLKIEVTTPDQKKTIEEL